MAVLMCVVAVSSCKKNAADTEEPIVVDNTPVEHADVPARPPKGCGGAAMSIHYADAYKTLRDAEEYKPGLRDYYVKELNDRRNEYFLASISANQRKEWVGSHGFKDKDLQCFLPIFEATNAAAKKTLPKYRPRGYTHHDSGEDELIREAVKAELPDAEFIDHGMIGPGENAAPVQSLSWLQSVMVGGLA